MNRITLVVDSSGSMYNCHQQMLAGVREMLTSIENNAKKFKQPTTVTLITFDSEARVVFRDVDASKLSKHHNFNYNFGVATALFDAVGLAHKEMKAGESYLIMVFTDGEENFSINYNAAKIKKLIETKQKTGEWTFAFNVPPGGKYRLESFGIPSGNIREWESSKIESVKKTAAANVAGLNSYYNSRTMGAKATTSFYTNLSSVKTSEVRNELSNLSKNFVQLDVDREMQIRDFVTQETGSYEKGEAYYQLVKPEVVQETKEILVMEKGKKAIWGGQDARDVIGLPAGRVKVIPGNHGKFEIFVQSTSVNRKTVPGTKILVKS